MLIDRASFFLMCRRRILARYRHTSSGFKRIIGRPDNAWAVKAEGVAPDQRAGCAARGLERSEQDFSLSARLHLDHRQPPQSVRTGDRDSLAAMAAPLDSAPLRLRAAQGLLTST
jgi:hypothetical protein